MNVIKGKEELINSLSHKEKVAIAISVIEEEIENLKKQLKEADTYTSRGVINQMIYELDTAKNYL